MYNKKCNYFGILNIFSLLLMVCTIICYYIYGSIIADKDLVVNNDEEFIVVLDPGHGGIDPGAVASDGTLEKNLNLIFSNYICEYLKKQGVRVVMTRDDDKQLTISNSHLSAKTQDLKARVLIANEHLNSVLVSIHMNKFSDELAKGLQVLYSSNGRLSQLLAESIQSNVIKKIQITNKRGAQKDSDSIYILKNAKVPAVLIECGFLSNDEELKLLNSKDYQQKLSESISEGILLYLGKTNLG